MSKLIEAAVKELDKYVDQYKINEELDYTKADDAEKHHEEHADKTKPDHEWPEGDTHHKVWYTTHKGKKSTLHHQSDPNASDAPLVRYKQAGHHSPDAIKKAAAKYD